MSNIVVQEEYNAGVRGLVDEQGISKNWYFINKQWHHCVSIISKGILKRYVDGVEQKDIKNE